MTELDDVDRSAARVLRAINFGGRLGILRAVTKAMRAMGLKGPIPRRFVRTRVMAEAIRRVT